MIQAGQRLLRAHWKLLVVVAAVAFVVVVGTFVVLYTVPVTHTFSGNVATKYCSSCTPHYLGVGNFSLPGGLNVTFRWQTSSGAAVNLSVVADTNLIAGNCSATGASGSCQFRTNGQPYFVFVDNGAASGAVTVRYSGTYIAPEL